MTIHVYSSADAGAPQIDRNVGSIINVLDACLVNGFGSGPTATPVGWTKEFSAANEAAYKMPAGTSERFLYVDDNRAEEANRTFRMAGYNTMTAIDAGEGAWPSSDGDWFFKAWDDGISPWWLIADEALFYLVIHPYSDNGFDYGYARNPLIFAFGDAVPFNAGDQNFTVLIGGTPASSDTRFYAGGWFARMDSTTGDNNQQRAHAYRNAEGSAEAPFIERAGLSPAGDYASSPVGGETTFYQSGGRLIAIPAFVVQRGLRGVLPGLKVGQNVDWGLDTGRGFTFEGEATEYFAVRTQGAGSGDYRLNHFIDLDGPWR